VNEIIMVGGAEPCGAYVLRLAIAEALQVRFGRFQSGVPVAVPGGEALYVGSAMARRGSGTLARRLLRHATRTDALRPQAVRPALLEALRAADFGVPGVNPPAGKRPFWHIDFLLEEPAVTLAQIFIVRSGAPLEDQIADMLSQDPATQPVASGLGAQDRPGSSHLLTVQAAETWWRHLPARLEALYAAG
jgi:Uri superfamily endonuclease